MRHLFPAAKKNKTKIGEQRKAETFFQLASLATTFEKKILCKGYSDATTGFIKDGGIVEEQTGVSVGQSELTVARSENIKK